MKAKSTVSNLCNMPQFISELLEQGQVNVVSHAVLIQALRSEFVLYSMYCIHFSNLICYKDARE